MLTVRLPARNTIMVLKLVSGQQLVTEFLEETDNHSWYVRSPMVVITSDYVDDLWSFVNWIPGSLDQSTHINMDHITSWAQASTQMTNQYMQHCGG